MSHINVKTSIYLEIILKSLEFFQKALHHFKKASIPFKMPSKSLVIFEKSSDFLLKPPFSENAFKKPRNFYKSLTLSLKMSSKLFKMPLIIGKSLNFSCFLIFKSLTSL
jgi:hypothetical protein